MNGGKSVSDYAAEQKERITAVPHFWELEPRAAALEYVRRNRPAEIRASYLLTTENPDNAAPPEEGELIYSDAPSGCFSPGGEYVHQLHCAGEGSYLVFSARIAAAIDEPLDFSRFGFEKVDLPYEQARHLLQTTWWLSRVRARQLVKTSNSYMNGGSTSDGSASTQFITAQENLTISAMRYAGHTHSFASVGVYSEAYDPSAFTNLIVKLFNAELPKQLGSKWTGMKALWRDVLSPDDEQRLKDAARELFQSHRLARLASAAIAPPVAAVGEFGWQDLQGEVEAVRAQLPPPLVHEQRLAHLEAELQALAEKLGPEANERARSERQQRRMRALPAPTIPGFDLSPGAADEKANDEPARAQVAADEAFAAYDSLAEKLEHLRWRTDPPERDIADLRQAIAFALQQLDNYHDPKALTRWVREEPGVRRFVLARLAKLDPAAASTLLEEFASDPALEKFASVKARYLRKRDLLDAANGKPPRALGPEERASFIAALRNPKADYEAMNRAFDRLFPPKQKARPDRQLDALLLELLKRESAPMEYEPERLQLAAAKRLGPKVWEILSGKLRGGEDQIPGFDEWLPALCEVALSQPKPFRQKLRKALIPELRASKGSLDEVLLAIWTLDLRELKPDIARLATSSPDDYQGEIATTSSTEKSAVRHRLHGARHIAALWNEEDAATRARLLVAFALAHADRFADREQPAARVWRERLAALSRQLRPQERGRALKFVEWCDTDVPDQAPWMSTQTRTLLKAARTTLERR